MNEKTDSITQLVILDDEDHIIRLLKALIPWDELLLRFIGSAHNGVDGKALILEKKPDIVITDIKMPGLDGLSLIADIYEQLPETDFIIVSGFSQFDYAKKAIAYNVENYLLKPINREELRNTLEKLVVKNRNRRKEIQAIQESDEQKKNNLFSRLLSAEGDGQEFAVCPDFTAAAHETARLCMIKTDSTGNFISIELFHLLADKISLILKKYSACRAVSFDQDIICFLCIEPKTAGDTREILSLIVFDLQKITELFPQLRFTLFQGKEITQDLHQEYAELRQMLPLRRRNNAPQIIPFEQISPPEPSDAILENWSRSCDKMLDFLDPAYADSVTTAFIQELEHFPEQQKEDVLITAGRRLAVKAEGRRPNRQNWFRQILLPALSLAGTAEDLHERFCTEIKKLIAEMGAEKQQETIRPVRIANTYMQNHYMDYDISLEKVAETVGLSPSYFSALYKKETGNGFLESLTAVRINKAKKLLQDSNDTVAKIATAVGYTDIKYFSRIFKKTTGITPNEFRQFYS